MARCASEWSLKRDTPLFDGFCGTDTVGNTGSGQSKTMVLETMLKNFKKVFASEVIITELVKRSKLNE